MSDVKLGQLIDGEAARDCLHIAVAPVVACEELMPGEHVGIQADGRVGKSGYCIGIVDPFLRCSVPEGGKFWLFLYQNTVTGMRHQWAHPSFDSASTPIVDPRKAKSERWLRDFAERWEMGFDHMVEGARDLNTRGICAGTEFEGPGELGSDHQRFWQHMEIFTGRKFTDDHRERVGWRCAC